MVLVVAAKELAVAAAEAAGMVFAVAYNYLVTFGAPVGEIVVGALAGATWAGHSRGRHWQWIARIGLAPVRQFA